MARLAHGQTRALARIPGFEALAPTAGPLVSRHPPVINPSSGHSRRASAHDPGSGTISPVCTGSPRSKGMLETEVTECEVDAIYLGLTLLFRGVGSLDRERSSYESSPRPVNINLGSSLSSKTVQPQILPA